MAAIVEADRVQPYYVVGVYLQTFLYRQRLLGVVLIIMAAEEEVK